MQSLHDYNIICFQLACVLEIDINVSSFVGDISCVYLLGLSKYDYQVHIIVLVVNYGISSIIVLEIP